MTDDMVMRPISGCQFDYTYRLEGTDKSSVESYRDAFLVQWGLAYFARGGDVIQGEDGKFYCNVSRAKKC